MPPGYQPPTGAAPLNGGVPWEGEGGLFGRWWETVKAANGDSRPFFAAASQNESGSAITFSMMSGGLGGAVIGLLYAIVFGIFGTALLAIFSSVPATRGAHGAGGAMAAGMGLFAIFYFFALTIGGAINGAIGPFIIGGVHHLILMMLGGIGQGKTFMHTVRTAAYSHGAAYAWMLIPIPPLAALVMMVFSIKNLTIGYDETHKCGTGKALLAIFAPIICCCICYALMFALGLGSSLMGASAGHR
jgi:hypothetical protein